MIDLMMENLVVTRMDMIRDTTNAKKISMTKYKKLMKLAITGKLVTRKDFKKDMAIVKKNSMAQLLCFTIPPFKFLVPSQALKRRNPPFSRL
jgi:hypothetical protein